MFVLLQVVLVVAANQQMRSTTNLLIINLAVADLLFIVFCVPFTGTDYALPFWPFGDTWCKIVQYLIVVTSMASVYTLVLMSLDRFLAVVYPISSMTVSSIACDVTARFREVDTPRGGDFLWNLTLLEGPRCGAVFLL